MHLLIHDWFGKFSAALIFAILVKNQKICSMNFKTMVPGFSSVHVLSFTSIKLISITSEEVCYISGGIIYIYIIGLPFLSVF